MVDSKAGKLEEKKVLLLPGKIAENGDVALLGPGNPPGLGVPTDKDITDYFRKPGTLAADRTKKGYGSGEDENPEGYEK